MKYVAKIFSACLLLGTLPSPASASDSQQPEQIAFVHLRFVGDTVHLVGLKVVPGHLKPLPESPAKGVLLQVVSSPGKLAWEGWIEDPATRSVEGPDRLGQLVRRKISVAGPEVTVRVPFLENGQSLKIIRRASSANAASAKLLATIPLHAP